jgi:flagellin
MSIVVNSNIPSMMAAHHMRTTRDGLETAMERLSSGKRINSADDDAAGAGIAARVKGEKVATDMAMRNAADVISIAQIGEAATVEIENMLIRLKELHIQQDSDTYKASDQTLIGLEITALKAEITRISGDTKWNGAVIPATLDTVISTAGANTTVTLDTLGDITTVTNLTTVNTALDNVATIRGNYGAAINRMEYTINNLSNISANLAAAHSRLMDTDYAAESANVAKGQVLQQAGAAMLAQANASTQYVLQLLQ